MNLLQAERATIKKQSEIAELEKYIELVRDYKPKMFTQEVVYEYAKIGRLLKVVDFVNQNLLRFSLNRYYTQADIFVIIRSKPEDELHKVVQKFLKKKQKG